jgi:hypothetical protein
MFRFTIRDVLWLTVVVGMGMGMGWWLSVKDRDRVVDAPWQNAEKCNRRLEGLQKELEELRAESGSPAPSKT